MNGGGRGTPSLTTSDIAAAIGSIQRRARDGGMVGDTLTVSLLLYLWAGMDEEMERCARRLMIVMYGWATLEKWRSRGPGWLRTMAKMALHEITARDVCRECSATGIVWRPGRFDFNKNPETGEFTKAWVEGDTVPCKDCDGLGVFPWSQRRRAAFVSKLFGKTVAPTPWRMSWDARYERVITYISEVENNGLYQLRAALKEGNYDIDTPRPRLRSNLDFV